MNEGADTGEILSQDRIVSINQEDDATSLYDKIVQVSLKQLSKLVPALESGSYNRIKQSNINANSWRKRNYNDGKIDWKMSSESIYNLIRALAKPYSGAHFIHKDKEYTVWK